METKQFLDVEVKAVDDSKGEFTALVSVFGNVDRVGDKVVPGAFTKSIEQWQSEGKSVPVVFSHQHNNAMAWIGEVDPSNMVQTSKGLFAKGQLDMDNEYARQTFKIMQKGFIEGFSFGYNVPKEAKGNDGSRELQEINLIEIGPCFKGVNPDAAVVAVKSVTDELLEGTEVETAPEVESPSATRRAQITQLMREALEA